MADKSKPEGFGHKSRIEGDEDDVEGHRHSTAREGVHGRQAREGAVEDDVEGHSMLPNAGLSRQLAQARERDIQQHLKRHEFEADARAAKKDHR